MSTKYAVSWKFPPELIAEVKAEVDKQRPRLTSVNQAAHLAIVQWLKEQKEVKP